MKMPTLLNVIRALLGLQSILIGFSIIFLIPEIISKSPDYPAYPLFDQIAYYANIALRIIFTLAPPLLTLMYISGPSYKMTITFMCVTLFFMIVFIPNALVLLNLFMLLTLLLHKPSKMYLKQEGPSRDYSQKDLQL
ncbi:hypothetical protein PAECIP112173_02474 [Paenibacillus sp. JJ-100]|uniref:hypothetical protein n=1 Tax=Paenibacillus sp. JJ-100 TaxID=2974896 RepID=UPI0022FF736A|nr:hypothetical protein [Paenibacillus sp. JJ-100]CAI6077298.1 hypothetical protein PAECIP112173_02474 [Paenibacillus sp. JJ-100]